MDRRSFLLGTTAAVTAGIPSGPAAAAARAGAKKGGASSHGPPDWRTLAASLKGTLTVSSDAAYPAQAEVYNALYAPRPAAIASCANASDVQRCVAFARAHHVAMVARSGGHSYGGYSAGPGLVIDVTPIHSIALGGPGAAGGTNATVGAGARLLDVYNTLGAQGRLLPGGSCPTVGIAGLALGGGIGVFGRAYGLTCDHIEAVQVVTADGVLRHCSPTRHADLYWASRGGGGGNFGVVTSFTFRTHPIPDVTLFTLEWPWAAAAGALDAWLRWIPFAPDELWANCQLSPGTTAGSGLVKVTGVYAGSVAACASALVPLQAAVGSAPTYRFVGPEDYLRAMLIEAGCEGKPVSQCVSTSTRHAFAVKSTFLNDPLPEATVANLVEALEDRNTSVPGAGGGIVFDGFGGAINAVGAAEMAFVHRGAIACAQYSLAWGTTAPPPATLSAGRAWLSRLAQVLAPAAQGSYQNYIDPTLSNWAQAYYGANLGRLRRVKAVYDPDNVFHFAQSIPLPRR
jgi:FAD/FMN-containing dehydrogenase